MHIRTFVDSDLDTLVELTIETFRPWFEGTLPSLMDPTLLAHQHGHWEQDYRGEVPSLHDPAAGKHVAVAEIGGEIAGYVAWAPDERPASGQVLLLAVAPQHRRRHLGRALCLHALEAMSRAGIDWVGIGTGGEDEFHAPARALYASLGLTRIPVAVYLGPVPEPHGEAS